MDTAYSERFQLILWREMCKYQVLLFLSLNRKIDCENIGNSVHLRLIQQSEISLIELNMNKIATEARREELGRFRFCERTNLKLL